MARVGAVFVGLAVLAIFSETELGSQVPAPERPDTLIVAHRGGAQLAPENTLAALNRAVRDGAAMAEVDVQQTRGGVLVLLHDSNLKRTAGLKQNVWKTD